MSERCFDTLHGSHEQSVRIATSDLVRAAVAEVADICREDS